MQTSILPGTPDLPLVVQPEGGNSPAALMAWLNSHRQWLDENLQRYGGLLFRGFEIHSAEEFQQVASVIAPKFLDYTRGTSPRSKVHGRVYTSTEAPRKIPIALHCELAYVDHYPDRIFFYCDTPPTHGGETPIADMRSVYQAIDPNVRRRFEERGLRIIQNVPGVKSWRNFRTWQQMFATEDRADVERACDNERIQHRWKPDGTLQLINTRPATIRHPQTGETIWFNSAHNFHDSWSWEFRRAGRPLLALLTRLMEGRHRRRLKPEDFPNHCQFGDGGEIPREDIEHIRQVLWNHAVLFAWQSGDVLLLDNLRIAHGRMPFRGPRRILVAMGTSAAAVEAAGAGAA
ncbi:MAG: TauD/TfdA family dioxygenase [Planctomycetaceae bacterium]|nr:TauD/TfdA family dioxygenase [Planctomycetaceae bacterium]